MEDYERSGKNDPNALPHFVNNGGSRCPPRVVMYFPCVSRSAAGTMLRDMALRLMPADSRQDVGVGDAEYPFGHTSSTGKRRAIGKGGLNSAQKSKISAGDMGSAANTSVRIKG